MDEQTKEPDTIKKRDAAIELYYKTKTTQTASMVGLASTIVLPLLYITHIYAGSIGSMILATYYAITIFTTDKYRKYLENKFQINPKAK